MQWAIENGTLLSITPLTQSQLKTWCQKKLNGYKLTPSSEALDTLLAFFEGNLSACLQSIEKLALTFNAGELTAQMVEDTLSLQANYSIYEWMDCCLNGDPQKVLSMLSQLKEEVEIILLLWLLTKTIRSLVDIQFEHQQLNKPLSQCFQKHKIWSSKQALYQKALKRHSLYQLYNLLEQCADIDKTIKGQKPGNAWQGLEGCSLRLAGVDLLVN